MDAELRGKIYQDAKEWILNAGRNIREAINDPLVVETKAHANDLVTEVDRETEYFLVTHIRDTYPTHKVFSEEGYGDDIQSLDGIVWIIDPIDGTMNFVKQRKNFAISIGIFHEGIGEIGFVYDVMSDILYSAKKGEGAYKNDEKLQSLEPNLALGEAILGFNHKWLCQNDVIDEKVVQQLVSNIRGSRAYGSAALKLAYVSEGIIDGYLTMNLAPWDIAGGMILANEVGAVTTNLTGGPVTLLSNDSTVTCHPAIQTELIKDYLEKGIK
ncbi:inositol monophosphatase family protein [Sporosarcina ureilytica]|uniref:inositol-phosphate phosphatase n=1 Tax=Sporosarcina ureilytica TaxID=298596 RepID=A0A1D8JIS5_9BACL|nr:inositol monophosphatase family protein [Sporosarcina ureilytica]AOV08613.1 inositol monophosphatase [Sporosarcina ureilytica]